jgi:hypothetical protein
MLTVSAMVNDKARTDKYPPVPVRTLGVRGVSPAGDGAPIRGLSLVPVSRNATFKCDGKVRRHERQWFAERSDASLGA